MLSFRLSQSIVHGRFQSRITTRRHSEEHQNPASERTRLSDSIFPYLSVTRGPTPTCIVNMLIIYHVPALCGLPSAAPVHASQVDTPITSIISRRRVG